MSYNFPGKKELDLPRYDHIWFNKSGQIYKLSLSEYKYIIHISNPGKIIFYI